MILRAFLWCVPRFIILIVVLTAIQEFDFSPLPAWTGIVVAYLVHFLLTYLAARWSFGKRSPTPKDIAVVAGIIVIFGTVLEALFYLYFHGWQWASLWPNYRWQSLYLIALYLIAVWFAGKAANNKNQQTGLPEGMAS